MKNNGGKINFLDEKHQQIKINVMQNNNNISLNQIPVYVNNTQYENINHNKISLEERKNVKFQQYIDPNTYSNNNVFTEFESIQNYSNNPMNIYKLANLPSKDMNTIYNNPNDNVNKQNKLISNNQNKQYKYKININENYKKRSLDMHRKTTPNFKRKKNEIQFKNNNRNIRSKQRTNLKIGTNLNIYKSEIQYPMNFSKNVVNRNNSKYKSYNNSDSIEENNEEEFNIKNPSKNHSKNKDNEIGNYYISSKNNNNSNKNKKTLRQNKSNFGLINKNKNFDFKSPNPIDINHLNENKFSNFNTFSKNENDTINSYKSHYNFYQKEIDLNSRKKNEINLNNLNTMNNYGYLNTISNSIEGKNKINPFYANINNFDIYENENDTGTNYINIVETDLRNNNKKIKKINNFNDNYFVDINNENLNSPRHKKGKKSVEILRNFKNVNNNNNEMKFNNILDINKYLQYKKKLLEEFCHCLEEFIFINVKNNFDSFIFKLREFCKKKQFNSLLLKRIQKQNLYKERSSSSNKYFGQNSFNQFYSSEIMNNSNFNIHRFGDYKNYNMPIDYLGRKTIYNDKRSTIMFEDSPRWTRNYRGGKSHGRYEINNKDDDYNYYYRNDTYYYDNNEDIYDYGNTNYRKNSIEKYNNRNNRLIDNNVYIPKKLKKIKTSKYFEKVNNINNYRNLNPNYNTKKYEKRDISPEIENVNKSHDIDNDIIKSKIKKNYNINNIKDNNLQDISYDNKNIINKKIENGLLNQTQNNNINNELLITKKKKINNQPIYKKKIKITQAKSKIFKNKQMPKNNINNLKKENNSSNEKKINPNLKENENNKIEKIKEQKIDLANYKNEKNNIKEENNLNLKNEKKENNKMDDGINNNLEPKEEDIYKENIEKNIYKI